MFVTGEYYQSRSEVIVHSNLPIVLCSHLSSSEHIQLGMTNTCYSTRRKFILLLLCLCQDQRLSAALASLGSILNDGGVAV